jgi:hypothetical protein
MRFCVSRISLASWTALVAAAALSTGCVGNTASASDAASGQAGARAFADAVNLRVSDMPGFMLVAATLGERGAPPGPVPRRAEECDGGPHVDGASRGFASSLFQKPSVPIQTVVSAVYPMRDRSSASAYIDAADSPAGLACIQREEIRRSAAARVRRKSEVVALRPPLAGVPVSGVRVWRCLAGGDTCKSSPTRSFTDRLWFAAGPYVVTLVYIAGPRNEAKGPKPLALPLERRLSALLYSRAQRHKP